MSETEKNRAVAVLSANLRRLRAQRGISMADLARSSGIGKATLSKLEAGTGNPTADTLWSLANALGVGISDLLRDDTPHLTVRSPSDSVWLNMGSMAGRLLDRIAVRGFVEVWEARFLQGQPFETDHAPGRVAGAQEHWLIRSGRLRMGPLDGQLVELQPGDFIRFVIDRPFVFEALDGDVDLIMLVNYPGDPPLRAV